MPRGRRFARPTHGGQAGTSSLIRNYLGFPSGISGQDLAARAYRQADFPAIASASRPIPNGVRRERWAPWVDWVPAFGTIGSRRHLHAPRGCDPLVELRARPSMVPLTDAWVEYWSGGERTNQASGTIIVNRWAADRVQAVTDDDLVEGALRPQPSAAPTA